MKQQDYLKLFEKHKKTGHKYQLWPGVVPPRHSMFPWSTSETKFENGIWLSSVCSTSPADLWRGGGRSADSTLMGRPTKEALKTLLPGSCSDGLAGHKHNELQTRESVALSPWNLVVGSGGRDWSQSDPARLWEARACHALLVQSFWNFLHTSPESSLLSCMEVTSPKRTTFTFAWVREKKMPQLHDLIIYYLRKLLTIASEHAPQLRISAWTDSRGCLLLKCAMWNALRAGIKNLVITHCAGGLVCVSWVACWEIN